MAALAGALPPRLLGVKASAAYLSTSRTTVRSMVADGRLPRVRIAGRKVLLDVRDLDRLIEAAKGQPQ